MPQKWSLKLNKKLAPEIKQKAAHGLFLAAEHILQVSNTHVPIREGVLMRSGVASVDEEALKAAVSYDTPYAVVQHEDMHIRHDPGRNAKFLENAGNSEAKVIGKIIADAIKQV